MAAMRLGCLFSQPANIAYLHKAQSPYSVNSLAVLAAQAAVAGHGVHRKLRRRSAGRARTALRRAWRSSASVRTRARRISCSATSASAPSRSATRCATRPSWCATAATKSPGCVRVTVGTREQTRRLLAALEEIWKRCKPLLVFDMDGVLVDVTESYRETIAQTVEHFTGVKPSRASRSRTTRTRAAGTTTGSSRTTSSRDAGIDVPFEDVKDYFQKHLPRQRHDGLILREHWIARPGTAREARPSDFDFAVFTGRPRAEAAAHAEPLRAGPDVRSR